MELELKAVGMRKIVVSVKNLLDARTLHNKFISNYELGSSTFEYSYIKEGGKRIAIVSYNGRIWTTEKDWKLRKEISVDAELIRDGLKQSHKMVEVKKDYTLHQSKTDSAKFVMVLDESI